MPLYLPPTTTAYTPNTTIFNHHTYVFDQNTTVFAQSVTVLASNTNRSSHLGIHKQTNACWRISSLVNKRLDQIPLYFPLYTTVYSPNSSLFPPKYHCIFSWISLFLPPSTCICPKNHLDTPLTLKKQCLKLKNIHLLLHGPTSLTMEGFVLRTMVFFARFTCFYSLFSINYTFVRISCNCVGYKFPLYGSNNCSYLASGS